MNNLYNRLLEKELCDNQELIDSMEGELMPTREMTADFKKTEEKSLKQIKELQLKYDIEKEDRKLDKKAAENRINTLIRYFVNNMKKLAINQQ